MMHIAVTITGFRGHLYQFLPLLAELNRRGHRLSMLLRFGDAAAAALLRPFAAALTEVDEQPPERGADGCDLSSMAAKTARIRRISILGERVGPTRRWLAATGADLVLTDACIWDTPIATAGRWPLVAMHASLGAVAPPAVACERLLIDAELADERRALYHRYGAEPLEYRRFECLSPDLNLIASIPELVGRDTLPPHTHLIGASPPMRPPDPGVQPLPATLAGGHPLIYLSFGTIYYDRAELLRTILDGLADLPVAVLLAAPALPAGLAGTLPANCTWRRFVDQVEVLRHSRLFVTHGGHGSFLEAVVLGIPMLVVPLASDQPLQAHYAEAAGVGRVLPPEAATPEAVRRASRALLDDHALRSRLRRLGQGYLAAGGARRGADLIEALADRT